MTSLMTILALYGLLCLLTILLQVLAAAGQVGLAPLAGNRDDMPALTGLAARLDKAQLNSAIAMALVAPPLLILNTAGVTAGAALLAAQLFLIARIAYLVIFALGVPWLRTAAWLVGFAMTAWLYLMVL